MVSEAAEGAVIILLSHSISIKFPGNIDTPLPKHYFCGISTLSHRNYVMLLRGDMNSDFTKTFHAGSVFTLWTASIKSQEALENNV